MREQMINMMTQPGMIDMIASSNPQLGQMINSMPMLRETMQNPEMMRMMLNPQMMRMMSQMNPALVGDGAKQGLVPRVVCNSCTRLHVRCGAQLWDSLQLPFKQNWICWHHKQLTVACVLGLWLA